MKQYQHETIIIAQDAWKFMWNFERERHGFKAISDEQLNKIWAKISDFRNGGANPKTHPISENEIRITKDTFNLRWDEVKEIIMNSNFSHRQDGFVAEGAYM